MEILSLIVLFAIMGWLFNPTPRRDSYWYWENWKKRHKD